MRFQKKLTIMYTLFTLVIACGLGIGYYKYCIGHFEKSEKKNLEFVAEQLTVQMEELIKPMELTMNYILSNEEMLSGIRILANYEKDVFRRYSEEAKSNIRKGITTDYINNNFYRVIIFNRTGNIVSTFDAAEKLVKQEVDFEEMPWVSAADEGKGTPVIVTKHKDNWGAREQPQVFSLLKAVQGFNMGYIEVQKKTDDLQEQLQIPREDIEYLVYINGDELLYSSIGTENTRFSKLQKAGVPSVKNGRITEFKEEIWAAKSMSDMYDIQVVAFEGMEMLKKENQYIAVMTLLIASVFFVISTAFVNLVSHYLTRPIRQLRDVMESTCLQNIGEKIEINSTNDEIAELGMAYQNVLECLQKAIIKEKRISMLHLRAQFDTLQSQVNPHFMYNVLNVISARGMQSGDEKICEICANLADMLRYSTNTKNRYAVIADELVYLEKYFYLLKVRFQHKIDFRVEVEDEVGRQVIPKVSLQQIVENCINHGFKNSISRMRVEIIGGCEENRWYIKVRDNGEGFREGILLQLQEKMRKTKKKILEEPDIIEMEIGGLGMVNIYARLLLMYNEDILFKMENTEDGAQVTIGGTMDWEE